MAKKKKVDLLCLVILGVITVALIMGIVGVCIAYVSTTSSTVLGGSSTTTYTLAKLAEMNTKLVNNTDKALEGFAAMAAFAYITLAMSVLTLFAFAAYKFTGKKALKLVVLIVSALLAVAAIVALITAFTFCSSFGGDAIIANAKSSPAAGCWLLAIFGILGGAAGVVGALKK